MKLNISEARETDLEEERMRLFEDDREMERLSGDLEIISEFAGDIQSSIADNGSISAIAYEQYTRLVKFIQGRGYSKGEAALESFYNVVLVDNITVESFTNRMSKAVKEAISAILNRIWTYLKDKARSWANAITQGSDYITDVNKVIKAIELLTEEEFKDSITRQEFGIDREAVLNDRNKDTIGVSDLREISVIYKVVLEAATSILKTNVAFFRNLTSDLYKTGSISRSIVDILTSTNAKSVINKGGGSIAVEFITNEVDLKTVNHSLNWAVKSFHTRFVPTGNARAKVEAITKKDFIDILILVRDGNHGIKPFYETLSREMTSMASIIKQVERRFEKDPGHGDTEYFQSGVSVASKIVKEVTKLGSNYLAPVHKLNRAYLKLGRNTANYVSNMEKRSKADKLSERGL